MPTQVSRSYSRDPLLGGPAGPSQRGKVLAGLIGSTVGVPSRIDGEDIPDAAAGQLLSG